MMAGQMDREAWRRRRGRNLAILAALVAFVGLIYWITLVRLEAGMEAHEREQQTEQSGAVDPALPVLVGDHG